MDASRPAAAPSAAGVRAARRAARAGRAPAPGAPPPPLVDGRADTASSAAGVRGTVRSWRVRISIALSGRVGSTPSPGRSGDVAGVRTLSRIGGIHRHEMRDKSGNRFPNKIQFAARSRSPASRIPSNRTSGTPKIRRKIAPLTRGSGVVVSGVPKTRARGVVASASCIRDRPRRADARAAVPAADHSQVL